MATSIFPDEASAAGVVIRDGAGNPTNPLDVHNAYPPAPPFLSTCLLTALPSTCDARIEPRQINAIVSELVSFAECLDPTGTWDCVSLKNLCAAFTAWMLANLQNVLVSDTPPAAPKPNALWWESDTGHFFLWYNDGTTTQWVQINGMPVFDKISIVGGGIVGDPHEVGVVDCGQY